LQIPYQNTQDKLENTLDYGLVVEALEVFLGGKGGSESHFFLLEYLAEQLSEHVLGKFPNIQGLFLRIQKAYLPLPGQMGTVSVEVLKAANADPQAPKLLKRAP
jgi:dihydroneopterin aldolase